MYHYKPFIAANMLLAIYLGVNAYAAFGKYFSSYILFGLVIFLLTQSYWIIRYVGYRTGRDLHGALFLPASVMFTLFTVCLILTAAMNIIWLMLIIAPFDGLITVFRDNIFLIGLSVVLLTVLIYFIGLYNARTPKVIDYNVSIEKELVNPIKIALIADVHIKSFTSKRIISRMVELVNDMDVDIVVFAGDLVDGEPEPYLKRGFDKLLSKLKPRYGTYAVMGNHEYYSLVVDELIKTYEKSGITVLRDKVKIINEMGIALIGRDDYMSYMFGITRTSLKDLVEDIPQDMPKVLIDHQPRNSAIKRAIESGVDLHLAGHTHNGQTFPINLIIKAMYKKAWGLYKKGAYSLVVTCGFGTWGTNIRIFSVAEIANITVTGGCKCAEQQPQPDR